MISRERVTTRRGNDLADRLCTFVIAHILVIRHVIRPLQHALRLYCLQNGGLPAPSSTSSPFRSTRSSDTPSYTMTLFTGAFPNQERVLEDGAEGGAECGEFAGGRLDRLELFPSSLRFIMLPAWLDGFCEGGSEKIVSIGGRILPLRSSFDGRGVVFFELGIESLGEASAESWPSIESSSLSGSSTASSAVIHVWSFFCFTWSSWPTIFWSHLPFAGSCRTCAVVGVEKRRHVVVAVGDENRA